MGEPGYTYPDGIFESKFIVEMMQKHVVAVYSHSVAKGEPAGALAMVATALDRAFLACQRNNGVMPEKPQDHFTNERYGKRVSQYMLSISKLRPHRWETLLELYGQAIDRSAPEPVELQDNGRDMLFIPPSPTK
ncbi:hypothetical protein MPER_01951 [Moniliophthora perniciosa FA553]|nr:hypothetical protein MPER_01951 [Moniliophthora perniciosa FA553]